MQVFKYLVMVTFLLLSIRISAQQVGIIDNGVYYSLNRAIQLGDKLKLVDSSTGKIYCCAKIIHQKLNKGAFDVSDIIRDRTVFAYSVSLPRNIPTDIGGFGVVGNAQLERRHGIVDAKLDGGTVMSLSTCTSAEGVHYLGRRVDTGKIIMHFYNYLDADLESTCKDLPQ